MHGIERIRAGLACLMALAAFSSTVSAADTAKDPSLFVILYKQGPAWKEGVEMVKQDAILPHYKYMKKGYEDGIILDAGATLDEPGGVVILRAQDLDAAKAFMAADPSVTMKMFVGEVHSWAPTFHSPDPLIAPPAPVKPERSVQGNLLSSSHDPAVQIGLPASATYVGADRWILEAYAADIELHAFVQADKDGAVQKLYWVQFEGYLPSHPEYHHMYDSTRHVTIGGLDFLVDTWAGYNDLKDEPDSDTQHLKALLKAKGYTQPRSMIGVRFVHLMDGDRKELMFIYKEPAPSGLSADDLKQGGKAYGQWADIEKGLVERGQQSIQLH